jgi:hypothetical protein
MDSDLENRWNLAVRSKNITQDELSRLVAKKAQRSEENGG